MFIICYQHNGIFKNKFIEKDPETWLLDRLREAKETRNYGEESDNYVLLWSKLVDNPDAVRRVRKELNL